MISCALNHITYGYVIRELFTLNEFLILYNLCLLLHLLTRLNNLTENVVCTFCLYFPSEITELYLNVLLGKEMLHSSFLCDVQICTFKKNCYSCFTERKENILYNYIRNCVHKKIKSNTLSIALSPLPFSLPACLPSNQCLTDTSLPFCALSPLSSFPLECSCLVGFLQDGIEDSEMFYILQMACDHNCTAEGSCWDLLIGCTVLRDHPPPLCVGAACWLWLTCVVPQD